MNSSSKYILFCFSFFLSVLLLLLLLLLLAFVCLSRIASEIFPNINNAGKAIYDSNGVLVAFTDKDFPDIKSAYD